jgi:phytoene desaturase
MKNISVIGAGISGISAAAHLAKLGYQVDVFEKHDIPGGRARQFKTQNGYTFDMGPSWYWMHDVFEQFFQHFGKSYADYYQIVDLNPQFEVVFENDKLLIPKDFSELKALFESIENGAGSRLDDFMRDAKYKYEISMSKYIEKPCQSITEFMTWDIIKSVFKLDLFTNFRTFVGKYFKDQKLISIMEFPVIFLGAAPKEIPAMYSLMNYGGLVMGTKYPMGGFFQVIEGMVAVAEEAGVKFHYNSNIDSINVSDKKVTNLTTATKNHISDAVVASADYHHIESMLPASSRNYDSKYWDKRILAPSALLFYIGLNGKLDGLKHHTLFFEPSLDEHLSDIYETKSWPRDPLFYVCCPSKSDESIAPFGHENLFFLMPIAPGTVDDKSKHDVYFDIMIQRLEKHLGINGIQQMIDYKRSYSVSDFQNDYNAYKGNAYGLANTLGQTAILKPAISNQSLSNLYYTGHLTVPGPGLPPSIISGKIVANEVHKSFK